ncbi:MAG TPA: hypothetical protein VME22_02670 [Solirubrobacteraceae bacterium]|nr:hypothetical protein [Solirubrobacteraceae bacterium]
MQSMTHAAHTRRHLSRHERQRQARAAAFSRRTTRTPIVPSPVSLATADLELIDRLLRRDRTAVSTALLAIAGIGAGEASRRAVLSAIAEAACWAQADGTISPQRAEQIARHVRLALAGGC